MANDPYGKGANSGGAATATGTQEGYGRTANIPQGHKVLEKGNTDAGVMLRDCNDVALRDAILKSLDFGYKWQFDSAQGKLEPLPIGWQQNRASPDEAINTANQSGGLVAEHV